MTQTRKEALIKVRDGVKAGHELDGFTVSCAFPDWKPMEKWSLMHLLEWACDPTDIRAMGAVKALHNAVLPGWRIEVFNLDGEIVLRRNRPINRAYGDAMAFGCPARAWLLAVLSALISLEENQ
jgi:hypothetical protein